ncbi:hypothetical protein D6C84_06343 [Aureobasidium pullulans]|uniref:Uncharacterized protein n=1 Tax=Aureobasidium pullulans TaxID=5580 RepID=A0A4S9XS45_AURPU|nr:hypothetical protein D6C84_06343 [Aureobasidium pullulans]
MASTGPHRRHDPAIAHPPGSYNDEDTITADNADQPGPSNSSQQPSGEPISWLHFDNSLQYMLPGVSVLSVPNDSKKVRLSWLIPADCLGYGSGLYALAMGMAADPDRTEAIDWEGRSPENTAFARLIDAVQQIRSRPLDKRNVGLEMLSAGGSTVAFHHLVVLIDYCNENPYEPKIDLFLAERGCIETKTPRFQDCKKWEGCGYAESAHNGTYRYQHVDSADVYVINDEESRLELHETPGDAFESGLNGLAISIAHDNSPWSREAEIICVRFKDHLESPSYRGPSELEPDGTLSSKALGAMVDWWNSRWKTDLRDKRTLYTGNSSGCFEEATTPSKEEFDQVFLVHKRGRWFICISGHSLPEEDEEDEEDDTSTIVVGGLYAPSHTPPESVGAERSNEFVSGREMVPYGAPESSQALTYINHQPRITSTEQNNTTEGLIMAVKYLTVTVATLTSAMQTNGSSSVRQIDHLAPDDDEEEVESVNLISFD